MYSNKIMKNIMTAMITVFFVLLFTFFTAKTNIVGIEKQSAIITKYYSKTENDLFYNYVTFKTEDNKIYESVYNCSTETKPIGTSVDLSIRKESFVIAGFFAVPKYIVENGTNVVCQKYKP